MAIPKKESLLVPYVVNWRDRVTATPADFGLTAGQAASLTAVVDPYVDAANVLLNTPGNRSPALTAARNAAKDAMMPVLRELYGIVQASLGVTDENKILLGVTVRSAPTPIPVPATKPTLEIVSTDRNRVTVRIHDSAGEGKRSKPDGVVGAVVMSYHGPDWGDASLYKWEGSTNRPTFVVEFPETLAAGTVVYLSAMWLNQKNQNGPACTPVSTTIQWLPGMGNPTTGGQTTTQPTLAIAA